MAKEDIKIKEEQIFFQQDVHFVVKKFGKNRFGAFQKMRNKNSHFKVRLPHPRCLNKLYVRQSMPWEVVTTNIPVLLGSGAKSFRKAAGKYEYSTLRFACRNGSFDAARAQLDVMESMSKRFGRQKGWWALTMYVIRTPLNDGTIRWQYKVQYDMSNLKFYTDRPDDFLSTIKLEEGSPTGFLDVIPQTNVRFRVRDTKEAHQELLDSIAEDPVITRRNEIVSYVNKTLENDEEQVEDEINERHYGRKPRLTLGPIL